MGFRLIVLMAVFILINGCSVSPTVTTLPPTVTITALPTTFPTATAEPTPEITPAPPTPTETKISAPQPLVCSPVAGTTLMDLADLVVNPYHPPRLGSDDPHQGLDFAVLDPVQGFALTGATVQTVLAGKVVSVTEDRFPYGNMLMVETPLEPAVSALLPAAAVPTPLPARLPRGALTCPELAVSPAAPDAPRSLYILYAHMLNPPTVSLGDTLGCGQEIGVIGQSGNALNPHVHVEVRVGPAGQTFPSMAHYNSSADYDEMAAYCTWRVSGVYQTINPACLWGDCATP